MLNDNDTSEDNEKKLEPFSPLELTFGFCSTFKK